ncbi:hypothetical protein BB560_004568 [Smittium megazygosporum]|uniref:Kinesin motor domain-containing protein n=1 Tax=Smittium megazygosporum TaxID=133381 RepID=A0A2T9Z8X6_9FUNG|nr:hypothetical protein BB560_004568 [Smittium megazygosporum]
MKDNINVAIRVRPLSGNDGAKNFDTDQASISWDVNGNTISQKSLDSKGSQVLGYTFDKVFDHQVKTIDIYNDIVSGIVDSALDGFNGTVFAYGQTSSGKTHTMYGNQSETGIIQLAIHDIFEHINKFPKRRFIVRLSHYEIYNEIISDLLDPTKKNLKISETVKREVYVKDSTERTVFSANEVFDLLNKSQKNRHIESTNMNEKSSRSHTIVRIVIESSDHPYGNAEYKKRLSDSSIDDTSLSGTVKVASLNLVDLAGSERVGHTGAEGLRLKEGGHINKSLLALGTVIVKLSEGRVERGHIPYRDSKLTRILQSSLGGNSRTTIICTITLASQYFDETHSTLKFANRAMTITNQPEINEELRGDALIQKLKRVDFLEKELETAQNALQKSEELASQSKNLKIHINWLEKVKDRLDNENGMLKQDLAISKRLIESKKARKDMGSQTNSHVVVINYNDYESLQNELQEKEKEINKYKSQMLGMEKDINSLNQENDEIKGKLVFLAEYEIEISKLRQNILDLKNKHKNDVLEYENSKSLFAESVDSMKKELDQNINEMSTLKNEYSSSLIKLEESIKIKNLESTDLKEIIKNQEEKIKSLEKRNLEFREQTDQDMESLEKKYQSRLDEVNTKHAMELATLSQKASEMQICIDNSNKLIESKDVALVSLNQEMDELKSNNNKFKQEISLLNNAIIEKEDTNKDKFETLRLEYDKAESSKLTLIDEINSLKVKNEDLTDQMKILKEELQSANQAALEKITNLENTNIKLIQGHETSLAKLRKEYHDKCLEKDEQIASLHSEYKSQVSNFESVISNLNDVNSQLRSENEQHVKTINEENQSKMDYLTFLNKNLETDIKSLKEIELKMGYEIKELKAALTGRQKEITLLKQNYESEYISNQNNQKLFINSEKAISNLKNELAENSNLLEMKSNIIQRLEKILIDLEEKVKLLSEECEQIEVKYNSLKDEYVKDYIESDSLLEHLSKNISEMGKEYCDLKSHNEYCEAHINDLLDKNNKQKSEIFELSQTNDLETSTCSLLRSSLEELKLEFVESKEIIARITNEKSGLVEDLDQLRTSIHQMGYEFKLLQNNLNCLSETIIQKENLIETYQTTINDNFQQLNSLETELANVKTLVEVYKEENGALKSEKLSVAANYTSDLEKRDLEVSKLKEERDLNLQMVEQAKSMMEEIVNIKDSELDKLELELNKKIQELNQKNSELQSNIENILDEKDKMTQKYNEEIQDSFEKASSLQSEFNKLRESACLIDNEKTSLENTVQLFQNQLLEKQDVIKALENDLANKTEESKTLNEQIDLINSSINKLNDEHAQIISELKEGFTREIGEKNKACVSLEQEINSLNCTVTSLEKEIKTVMLLYTNYKSESDFRYSFFAEVSKNVFSSLQKELNKSEKQLNISKEEKNQYLQLENDFKNKRTLLESSLLNFGNTIKSILKSLEEPNLKLFTEIIGSLKQVLSETGSHEIEKTESFSETAFENDTKLLKAAFASTYAGLDVSENLNFEDSDKKKYLEFTNQYNIFTNSFLLQVKSICKAIKGILAKEIEQGKILLEVEDLKKVISTLTEENDEYKNLINSSKIKMSDLETLVSKIKAELETLKVQNSKLLQEKQNESRRKRVLIESKGALDEKEDAGLNPKDSNSEKTNQNNVQEILDQSLKVDESSKDTENEPQIPLKRVKKPVLQVSTKMPLKGILKKPKYDITPEIQIEKNAILEGEPIKVRCRRRVGSSEEIDNHPEQEKTVENRNISKIKVSHAKLLVNATDSIDNSVDPDSNTPAPNVGNKEHLKSFLLNQTDIYPSNPNATIYQSKSTVPDVLQPVPRKRRRRYIPPSEMEIQNTGTLIDLEKAQKKKTKISPQTSNEPAPSAIPVSLGRPISESSNKSLQKGQGQGQVQTSENPSELGGLRSGFFKPSYTRRKRLPESDKYSPECSQQ